MFQNFLRTQGDKVLEWAERLEVGDDVTLGLGDELLHGEVDSFQF